jgi:hypothetical protein
MKQVASDKYTIAWFKLAECVSRGERERALGVYRLLSHSIGNPAFESQLEGDLYLSFNDHVTAIAKYQDAVRLYGQAGRQLEAVAVLEHIAILEPHHYKHHEQMIGIYHALRLPRKVNEHSRRAIDLLLHDKTIGDGVLQEFLALVRAFSEQYYMDASEYIESGR